MNISIESIEKYAEFLEDNRVAILKLCENLESNLSAARQYMDQESSFRAVQEIQKNIENIKGILKHIDGAARHLALVRKQIIVAQDTFKSRSR